MAKRISLRKKQVVKPKDQTERRHREQMTVQFFTALCHLRPKEKEENLLKLAKELTEETCS